MLDANGYIEQYDERYILESFKISKNTLETIIMRLQNFEPVGIFARNLTESLIIQLKESKIFDKIFSGILSNKELLCSNNYRKLAKKLKISLKELVDRISVIQTLNPSPVLISDNMGTEYVHPDINMAINDSNIVITSNKNLLPSVQVDKQYYEYTSFIKSNFIRTAYSNAQNLVRYIGQRSKTLMLVTESIVTSAATTITLIITTITSISLLVVISLVTN